MIINNFYATIEIMKNQGSLEAYSISKKLKKKKKITEEFEVMLSGLTLEDIISLKLELSSNLIKGKLYGTNIYNVLPLIAREAALKYALSACKTKNSAAAFLGISYRRLKQLQADYNIYEYFKNGDETVSTER